MARMNAVAAPADPEPLLRLWAAARALLAEMIKLFGAPEALSARLDRALRRALSPWVRSLEELVRKLLLAEAAAQVPCTAAARRPPARARFAPAHNALEIAAPARPRARFSLAIPRDERIVPDHRAPRIRALWNDPAAPAAVPATSTARAPRRAGIDRLALRFAALRCVLEKPAPYVRRLAARLARLARDQRSRAALRFVCRGADRVAPGFGDALRSAGALAFARAEKLSDTS
jgi:hypothetical protein